MILYKEYSGKIGSLNEFHSFRNLSDLEEELNNKNSP